MSYSPTMIANNILSRAFAEKIKVTPMKLQKILYFIASEYQKRTHKTLIAEPFQTWAYGPVLRSVYDKFRPFSKAPIRRYARDAQGNAFVIDEDSDLELKHSIDHVWQAAKNMNAVDLSELTRLEGSAWDNAFQEDRPILDPEEVGADYTYREALEMSGAGSAFVD